MHYVDWGFSDNPFATSSLPPNEDGSRLMVDRTDLIRKIQTRVASGSKIVTVEGLNGVGKTSLVNVAIYRHFKNRLSSDRGPLLVPCRNSFQIETTEPPASFKRRVLLEVIQTLIEQRNNLPIPSGFVKVPKNSALEIWLNSPVLTEIQAGMSFLGSGGSLGKATSPNSSTGFDQSGVEKAITDWLRLVFPTKQVGGIVCTIDNIELLQTSKVARETIESLRDTLLTLPGIRWILCGALGIVNGVVSSPRMDGYLHRPIEVLDLGHEAAADIFEVRVNALRTSADARLPLTEVDFVKLFDLYHGNLRSVLAACDEFCSWVAEECDGPGLFDEDLFESWLTGEMHSAFVSVKSELRPKAYKIFELACKMEVFSPSDCEEFGYKTPMALRPQIKALEEVGVLVSTQDDTDKRRKTIQVTPKGWLVRRYIEQVGT
jgi:hypothetical protein